MKKLMTRKSVQEALTDNILANIIAENENGSKITVTEMTVIGWKGYGYMTTKELEAEYKSVYCEEIQIEF